MGVLTPPIIDVSHYFKPIEPNAQVHILLDFINHKEVSGNKLRKLLPAILHFKYTTCQKFVSFGGYYSNHLSALSWLGNFLNIPTVGYINGPVPKTKGNTLCYLEKYGMQLHFLSKKEFASLSSQYTDYTIQHNEFIIPLGGQSIHSTLGFEELYLQLCAQYNLEKYSEFRIASGTGNSALSLLLQLPNHQRMVAQKVVKDPTVFNTKQLQRMKIKKDQKNNLILLEDELFGGIGKYKEELLETILIFYERTGIPLDPIYTGKLIYYFEQDLKRGIANPKNITLLIHTGGLQGIKGFNTMHKTSLPEEPNYPLIQKNTLRPSSNA